mmetsp:Transcript_56352/g.123234  ORF Transcript_56352/g.123234 Transcript_56352/m.123234 type:complete len:330 (+) Transcript_56352:234-1223(+)
MDENATAVGLDAGIRRLQSESALLAKPVGELIRSVVGLGLLVHITSRLTLLPEELQAHQIAQCHGSHGHAKGRGGLIDLLDGGALLCHHLRFARIRRQHAIAHEAIAVADHHSFLANDLGHLHAGGEGLDGGFAGANVLQKLHDIGRREEVGTHDSARILQDSGDVVDVQAAGVGANEAIWLGVGLDVQKALLLQIHNLGYSLDDHVHILEVCKVQGRLQQAVVLLIFLLAQLALLQASRPEGVDLLDAAVQPFLLGILQNHWNTLLNKAHCDASTHQARAQDANLLQRQRLLVHARDLLSQALGEEQMPQGGALHREDQLGELFLFDL